LAVLEQFNASSFLSRQAELSQYLPSQFELPSSEVLISSLAEICDALESPELDDLERSEQILLQAKVDFCCVWSVAELSRLLSQPELGRWQSLFAEASINYALKLAWLKVGPKHRVLSQQIIELEGDIPGLFIFGMGKLGGYDLNFSSDVDVVAYFDPDVLPVPDTLGKSYVCHQVLQVLTKLLAQSGESNFVWRVDWRLRPNASATTLAMSVAAAEDYYFYRASPWHRLALMKARVVAGDMALGARFLKTIKPFVWRQNLDYRALDELAEINCNALQLLWGGRHRSLRTSNTLEALSALSTLNKLDQTSSNTLAEAYQYLRRLENAIQMQGNQHTHLIPNSEELQQSLLVLLGLHSWQSLVQTLNEYRVFVHRNFEELFAEQAAAQGEATIWPANLTSQADEIVDSWEAGFINYGVSTQVRHRLRPLTRGIARYLSSTGGDVSNTVMRLHDFFRSLPSGEQYFRLLAESPVLLESIVPPLLHSPAMTLLLKQSPHIIDCYVHERWSYPQPFDSDYVLHTDDYGERLELMRRFVNEHLYQLYLSFLNGAIDVSKFQAALTALAEHSLDLALNVVTQNMQLESVPITVVGMGKVALGKMSPLSDLDLIFVFDQEETTLELASRFVSRLQTAIATPMREGILYELDTRLRPSGRSGAPTVSVESFASHHRQRAHTWEHIALVPSRVVAGNRAPEIRLNEIKAQLLKTPRDQAQLNHDAQKMWRRIAEHRVKSYAPELMFSKLREGGLMQAEYLAACLIIQPGHSGASSEADFDQLLMQVDDSEKLSEVIQFWRVQQLWERLLGKSEQPLDSLPDLYLRRLLEHSGVATLEQLIDKKKEYSSYVLSRMDTLFDANRLTPEQLENWLESNVSWLAET